MLRLISGVLLTAGAGALHHPHQYSVKATHPCCLPEPSHIQNMEGVQWLSGRVLDLKPRGCNFEPHLPHYVVSLSKNINPSLVLVQPRKTRPFITERLLMGCKESNQTNKTKYGSR